MPVHGQTTVQGSWLPWFDAHEFLAVPTWTKAVKLGAIRLSSLASRAVRLDRTRAAIRRTEPDDYQLALVQDGAAWLVQMDRVTELTADQFLLVDGATPIRRWRPLGGGSIRVTVMDVPKQLLASQVPCVDELVAVPFSARSGSAGLLGRLMVDLVDQSGDLAYTEREDLAKLTLDLLGMVCAHQVGARARRQAPDQQLMADVLEFVHANLSDPGLSPASIAGAHHISVRHLHSMFEQDGRWTVAQLVRQLRLDRCRADLADPRQATRPIAALAARWGFLNPAHFSRVFRAEFGMTPRAYRNASTGGYA